MTDATKGILSIAGVFVLIITFILAAWVFHSYMEARAYTRVTGKEVTTFDAMFLDLRVQEAVADE